MSLSQAITTVGLTALLGCNAPALKAAPAVASVNGVEITQAELGLALKPTGHGGDQPDRRGTAIAALVHDELVRQKATELGLEPEGPLAEEIARLEAQLAIARRRALNDAYYRHEIEKKAEPTDGEARAYFATNAAMLRAQFHLFQILTRDEAQILSVQRELATGAAFEDVARRQFPGLPEAAGLPWELGDLSWKQLPEPWRPVLEAMKPGDVSPIIHGAGGRFWILKLVERRANPALGFEDVRASIVEDLKRARLAQLAAQTDLDLRKTARIVIHPEIQTGEPK